MKKIQRAPFHLLILAFLLSAWGCGGAGGSGSSAPSSGISNEVTLTGAFTGGTYAKSSWLNKVSAALQSKAFALDANQVSKVIAFTAGRNRTYKTASVDNGIFTINVKKDEPVGIIFVAANNQFLGYLTLKDGIESLPMKKIRDNLVSIDLGLLYLSNLAVYPSNNPFGNEIQITPEELKALAQFNGPFAAFVRNPDVDGNGVIDFLENKRFFLELAYGVVGGSFDSNLTPTINSSLEQYQIHFFSNISDCPNSVTLTGPNGSPFSIPTSIERVQIDSYCTHKVRVLPSPGNFEPPVSGNYILDYTNDRLIFNIPDQSLILQNMISIVPTVTLNADGFIQKISWVYRLAGGSDETFSPESMITQIQITIADQLFSAQNLYSSPFFSTSTTEIDLSTKGIRWNDVGAVNTSYYDVFGNGYAIKWYRFSVHVLPPI